MTNFCVQSLREQASGLWGCTFHHFIPWWGIMLGVATAGGGGQRVGSTECSSGCFLPCPMEFWLIANQKHWLAMVKLTLLLLGLNLGQKVYQVLSFNKWSQRSSNAAAAAVAQHSQVWGFSLLSHRLLFPSSQVNSQSSGDTAGAGPQLWA